jgi:hypothetical protein
MSLFDRTPANSKAMIAIVQSTTQTDVDVGTRSMKRCVVQTPDSARVDLHQPIQRTSGLKTSRSNVYGCPRNVSYPRKHYGWLELHKQYEQQNDENKPSSAHAISSNRWMSSVDERSQHFEQELQEINRQREILRDQMRERNLNQKRAFNQKPSFGVPHLLDLQNGNFHVK